MDLFAAVLVSITVTTICGICLFIFVCALQPRFLRKLYGKSSGIDQETNFNQSPDREGHLSVKSLDLANGPYASTTDGPASKEQVTGRDKKAFLRAVEQSIRTGQRIQSGQNDDNPSEHGSHADPSNYFYRFINKYLHRRTNDTEQTSDI